MKQLLLSVLLFSTSTALAADPVLDTGSIALGSALSTFQENSRFECNHVGKPIADDICNLAFGQQANIATVPVIQMLLYFYDGKLHAIGVFFEEKHFAEVSTTLVEKYGHGKTTSQVLRNRAGDKLKNTIRSWRKGTTTMEVSRYAGRPTRSKLTYRTDHAIEEFKRRSKTPGPSE